MLKIVEQGTDVRELNLANRCYIVGWEIGLTLDYYFHIHYFLLFCNVQTIKACINFYKELESFCLPAFNRDNKEQHERKGESWHEKRSKL